MRILGALLWGAILGAASVLLHDAYLPYGLLFVLLCTGIGTWLLGRAWGFRRYKIISAVAWIGIVLRAGSLGTGGELLVQGNSAGNALVAGGFIILIFAILAPS